LGVFTNGSIEDQQFDPKRYAVHVLKQGSLEERREFLGFLQTKIVLTNKKVSLLPKMTV